MGSLGIETICDLSKEANRLHRITRSYRSLTFCIQHRLRTTLSEEKVKSTKKKGFNRLNEMKLIVADTSAGKIIGKKGETVKKIQEVNHSLISKLTVYILRDTTILPLQIVSHGLSRAPSDSNTFQENKVKLVLTSKGSWGVVPGERVATVSGEEDNVNSAIEEILAVVAVSISSVLTHDIKMIGRDMQLKRNILIFRKQNFLFETLSKLLLWSELRR